MKRLGVVGIVVEGSRKEAGEIQSILSEYGHLIKGRMGLPDKANDISIISLIVEGENEQISDLTGRLGRLQNVSVK